MSGAMSSSGMTPGTLSDHSALPERGAAGVLADLRARVAEVAGDRLVAAAEVADRGRARRGLESGDAVGPGAVEGDGRAAGTHRLAAVVAEDRGDRVAEIDTVLRGEVRDG